MDKKPLTSKNLSGERLRKARNIKTWRRKDLANEFDTSEATIIKWQQRGIPHNKLDGVANYFGVNKSAFVDSSVSESDFELMISESMAGIVLNKIIFTHQGSGIDRSPIFKIPVSKVLLKATVWGVEGITFSQFILTPCKYDGLNTLERKSYGELPVLRIITDSTTQKNNINSNILIRERTEDEDHYISLHTPNNFRVSVYDIKG